MEKVEIENIIEKFSDLTADPVKYLRVQDDITSDVKLLVKSLYDYTKCEEKNNKKKKHGALHELIIDDFDEEQIWQQIELQNTECWDQLVWDVANCISKPNELQFPVEFSDRDKQVKQKKTSKIKTKSVLNKHDNLDNHKVMSKNKSKDVTPRNKRSNTKSSIVDDQFFKLTEMEKFLINEEKNEGKTKKKDEDEESIDLFEDIDDDDYSEDGGTEMMYKDFFIDHDGDIINDENDLIGDEDGYNQSDDENEMEIQDSSKEIYESSDERANESDESPQIEKNKEKKVRFANLQPDSGSDSASDNSKVDNENTNATSHNDKQSEFELRQQRLKQQISKLEEKTITDKPWQLKGEIDATKRPQNSLLQEVLDFDLTTRPAPIITEQTTVTLEGLIRQRIKDKAWDDVVKKERPVDDQLTFKKTEVLDHAKSKQSLAQVYEAEYLKQKQALSGEKVEEEEPESHKEIRDAMSTLFAKLDALCHYHYTPKAPQAEVKIVSNTPAISMEEVAPVGTSDAALLAPEEVKKKSKGDLMSKEERTQTDKNRERRKKKKLQRQKGGQVTKITDHRNTTKGVEASDKSLKTSKAFFQQLNDDATSLIKNKSSKNKNK